MNGNNQKVTSLSEVGQRERRKERETQRVNIKRKAIKQERTEEIGQTNAAKAAKEGKPKGPGSVREHRF